MARLKVYRDHVPDCPHRGQKLPTKRLWQLGQVRIVLSSTSDRWRSCSRRLLRNSQAWKLRDQVCFLTRCGGWLGVVLNSLTAQKYKISRNGKHYHAGYLAI